MPQNVTSNVTIGQRKNVTSCVIPVRNTFGYALRMDNPLKRIRTKLGLDQEALASIIEISRVHVSRLENAHSDIDLKRMRDIIKKINTHYGEEKITLNDFFLKDSDFDNFIQSEEEKRLIETRRSLKEEEQRAFDVMTATVLETIKSMRKKQ